MDPKKTIKKTDKASFASYGEFAAGDDGSYSDISLLSIGEAKGHGVEIDMKSLETAFNALGGRALKAFNNHSFSPAASDTVGIFSGIHIDAKAGKLRAKNFQWLSAFQKHREGEFETLAELAAEHPESFGISLTHRFDLVWVFAKGVETPAMEDYWYDRPAPKGALNRLPVVRFKSLISADFVGSPAANDDGLFSAGNESETNHPNKDLIMLKEIHAAYSQDKDLLSEAIQFATANDGAEFSAVQSHVKEFAVTRDLAAKDAEIEKLKGQLSAANDKVTDKEAEIGKLNAKITQFAGGEGEFSTGDAPAPASGDTKPEDIKAQYAAMEPGKARTEFREKHASVIFAK